MTVYRQDTGAQVTKTQATALLTEVTQPVIYEATVGLVKARQFDGEDGPPDGRVLAVGEGQQISATDLDAMFPVATITSVTPATGPAAGGTAVTIKGTNFTTAPAVTFGGTTATSIVVVDTETITCVTPAKTAGDYDVVVTNDSGTAATLTDGFTYT